MLIGAYGTFWDRDLVNWNAHGWRLLGRQGLKRGTLKVADFRKARGVYVMYSDTGIYYVGLASGSNGIGGRLHDHLTDEHGKSWSRFSWFAFDSPSETETHPDGVLKQEQWPSVEGKDTVMIREMEALLIAVTDPPGNRSKTRFAFAPDEWHQVAERTLSVRTLESLAGSLRPQE